MALTRIHHVGMVTGELENARKLFCDGFGLAVDEHRTPWPQGRSGNGNALSVVEFPIGEMYYEVTAPNDSESNAARFLDGSGGRGGIHYLSIASNDIGKDVQALMNKGVKLQGDWHGEGPVFLDPASCLGLEIQITPDDAYFVHPSFRGKGLVMGMAHVGLAARSAEEIRQFWGEIMGLSEDKSMERGLERDPARAPRPAGDPVHLLEFPLGGSVVEVSVPTTDDSGTARLVAQKATQGAVYHHTCPYTPDVHAFTEGAVAAGIQQIGSIPPKEERERVVAWFHPRSCLGMLVEAWNRPSGDGHFGPAAS